MFNSFIKGVGTGFGEKAGGALGDAVFGLRSNTVNNYYYHQVNISEFRNEMEDDIREMDFRMSQLESQVYEINSRIGVLDMRVDYLMEDKLFGALGLGLNQGNSLSFVSLLFA